MEDFLSNKDSSDEFIGQSPVGKIVNFAIKTCRHRLYTGYKGRRIIGVSVVRHKRRIRPFSVYGKSAQLINIIFFLTQRILVSVALQKCYVSFDAQCTCTISISASYRPGRIFDNFVLSYSRIVDNTAFDLSCFPFPLGQLMTATEVNTLKEELKTFYRIEFNEIKTSPLDPLSLRKLDHIYVHLLLLGEETYERPKQVEYDELFEIFENESEKARIAFLGEAGVGKTTLLAKIAHDWAMGSRLHDVDLLFYVHLREIENCAHFAEIPRTFLSDGLNLSNTKLNEYLRTHQRKIVFLLDGLDEYKGDIKQATPNDDLIQIMRGDKFKRAPVIVTTRPWRAEQITSVEQINKKYKRMRVEGFTKQGVQEYIKKFFKNDMESAKSLIYLATKGSLVAQTMAPYPIFCCMLCHMWKWLKESERDRIRKLETFSELTQEMINALVEQCAEKLKNKGESLNDCQMRCKESFERIGEVAFRGLLVKQLAYDVEEFRECMGAMQTGCEVGVLSSKKKFAHSDTRQRDGTEHISEVSFPHKLMQEYLAGYYLASLYRENPKEFEELLKKKVLDKYDEFRYLLYFTVPHGKRDVQAGRHLMESLCKALGTSITNTTSITDLFHDRSNVVNSRVDFLVDVAFECHDEEAIRPVIYLLRRVEYISLSNTTQGNKHLWSGYTYAFAACDIQPVIAVCHNLSTLLGCVYTYFAKAESAF